MLKYGGSNEFYKKIYLENNLLKHMLQFKGEVTIKMSECSVYNYWKIYI